VSELPDRRAPVRNEEAQTFHPEDFYPTPAWVTRALLEAVGPERWCELFPTAAQVLEPAAGHGAIIEALPVAQWTAVELRAEAQAELLKLVALTPRHRGRIECPVNYLHRPAPERAYDLAITNPPFHLAERFIAKMMQESRVVVALLEAAFLGSQGRSAFHQTHPADVLYLSERPSFTGEGSGRVDYAWFAWPAGALGLPPAGSLRVVPKPAAPQGRLFP
jgi:hypothetical protein